MAGEMDLADMFEREGGEIIVGAPAVIGGGDVDIVDVEQEAAAGAADDAGERKSVSAIVLSANST